MAQWPSTSQSLQALWPSRTRFPDQKWGRWSNRPHRAAKHSPGALCHCHTPAPDVSLCALEKRILPPAACQWDPPLDHIAACKLPSECSSAGLVQRCFQFAVSDFWTKNSGHWCLWGFNATKADILSHVLPSKQSYNLQLYRVVSCCYPASVMFGFSKFIYVEPLSPCIPLMDSIINLRTTCALSCKKAGLRHVVSQFHGMIN